MLWTSIPPKATVVRWGGRTDLRIEGVLLPNYPDGCKSDKHGCRSAPPPGDTISDQQRNLVEVGDLIEPVGIMRTAKEEPVTQDVRAWIDPSCPWCWQTARWLFDLREAGRVALSWSIFSLELNASPDGAPFWEAASRYGGALVALALARRQGTDDFERLYLALGQRLHDQDRDISPALVSEAADQAGLPGLADRASAMPDLVAEITQEFHRSRDASVFGVPTIQIGTDKVLYGPLLATPPTGEDILVLWEQINGLSARPGFFELKRWPRDLRPGQLG